MLNFLINFSLLTFLCYAVSGPVREILFPAKKRNRRRTVRPAAGSERTHVCRTQKPKLMTAQKGGTQKPARRFVFDYY